MCTLHYLFQLSGEVANELLPILNGELVPLGSLRCQSDTGPDIPGHSPYSPLGDQKVRHLLVTHRLCSGWVSKESKKRRRMRRGFS